MASLLTITIVFSCLSLFFLTPDAQTGFTIKRTASGDQNFDNFKVPESNCTDSGSHCKQFHEQAFATLERCACSCPYIASTFGFIRNSTWGCIENSDLRSKAGLFTFCFNICI